VVGGVPAGARQQVDSRDERADRVGEDLDGEDLDGDPRVNRLDVLFNQSHADRTRWRLEV
jgi:hypothetical protein